MPERTIAIVDDHVMFRKGLVALINLFPNYEVTIEASNGKEFIETLQVQSCPHIVLLDISMPVMDGYATAAWVRDNYPDTKIIALSTMESDTSIIKMIKNGAKGYVLKDADPSELKRAFDEIFSRGYFYNETVTRKVMNAVNSLVDDNNSISTFTKLSSRETEFLKLCCTELTYKEIADKMHVSTRTAEGYRDSLCEKLELKTRVGLAMYAIKNKLVAL